MQMGSPLKFPARFKESMLSYISNLKSLEVAEKVSVGEVHKLTDRMSYRVMALEEKKKKSN